MRKKVVILCFFLPLAADFAVDDDFVAPLSSFLFQMSEKMELSEKQAEEGLVDEAQALLAEV